MTANLHPCICGNTEYSYEYNTKLNDDYLSSEDRDITVMITLTCTKCDKSSDALFDLRRVYEN